MFIRAILTLLYGAIGLAIAYPLSYWFQSSIYREMTWAEYIASDQNALMAGAQFGSFDVYRYSVIGAVIGMILLGRLAERLLFKNKH